MPRLSMSICDFALPSPMSGDLTLGGFSAAAPERGQELHQYIQSLRCQEDACYQTEYYLKSTFSHDDLIITVSGRADGLFVTPSGQTVIEEIKSSYDINQLRRQLQQQPHHPYVLQTKTYAYLYYKINQQLPQVRLCLICSKSKSTHIIDLDFSLSDYEEWLACRLADIKRHVTILKKSIQRRKKSSKQIIFPFTQMREQQDHLIEFVSEHLKAHKYQMIQAPTGLGKTIATTFASLKHTLSKGEQLFYAAPKNSQFLNAENAVRSLQFNSDLHFLTLTARSKICLKETPICHPAYCEFAKGYYDKLNEHNILHKMQRRRELSAKSIIKYAKKYQVCPYQLSQDLVPFTDVVIGDYNFFLKTNQNNILNQPIKISRTKPSILIDEAHHLHSRAISNLSLTFDLSEVSQLILGAESTAKSAARSVCAQKARKALKVLTESCADLSKMAGLSETALPRSSSLLDHIKQFQGHVLEDLHSIFEHQQTEYSQNILRLLELFTNLATVLETPQNDGIYFHCSGPAKNFLHVTCCDASTFLGVVYKSFDRVVAFSATMKPFDEYGQLCGFMSPPEAKQPPSKHATIELPSPFPTTNKKVLIIPQVSTRLNHRVKTMPKVREIIQRICKVKKGHYLIFCPSYAYMNQLTAGFACDGFEVQVQPAGLRSGSLDNFINHLKDSNTARLIFAVHGGLLSEGLDISDNLIKGIFIVGPGLPFIDQTYQVRHEYFQKKFPGKGDYLSGIVPAMTKVIQACGRLIRSETDKGIMVLIDDRFTKPEYANLFPKDWITKSPDELVSRQILKDIENFWQSQA